VLGVGVVLGCLGGLVGSCMSFCSDRDFSFFGPRGGVWGGGGGGGGGCGGGGGGVGGGVEDTGVREMWKCPGSNSKCVCPPAGRQGFHESWLHGAQKAI